jgi:CRISPR/Cas system-associated endonuclease Cas1
MLHGSASASSVTIQRTAALFRISEVVIASPDISISFDLIEEFGERGIRLSFLDRGGRPYAMLVSPTLTATGESRREQLKA